MKKLKLNLDDLQVESFETTPEEQSSSKGTVFGYALTFQLGCTDGADCPTGFGAPTCYTCANTCANTCGNTCPNTCANTCPNTCAHTCQGNTCNGGFTCGGATCGFTCGPSCFNTCPVNCPILP